MKRLVNLLTSVLLVVTPVIVEAATWQIDPAHATIEFKVRHLMVAWVKGTFPTVAGFADVDEADLSKSTVSVTIDTTSIDTNNAKRDEHLRSADFFDVAKFPTMTFVSKKVIADGTNLRQIIGDLTIRGTTREVTLDVEEFTPAIKDPWGNLRRGVTATTTVNRKDFGLAWNKLLETGGVVVGDEVRISLNVELIQK